MTYVLAWKTNAAIYVSTDTVKTVDGNYTVPVDAQSTFFERHIVDVDNNHFVHEGIIKIFNIEDSILFAFAGDVRLAYDIFETFQHALKRNETNVRLALDDAISMALPIENFDEVVIAVAFIDGETPVLLTCEEGTIDDCRNLVHFGSFTEKPDLVAQVEFQIKQGIDFVNSQHKAGTVDDQFHQTVLSRVNGLLQSIGIHNPLIDIGVGGTFVSAAVAVNFGFVWPKANRYVLYPTKRPFKVVRSITVRYIDNIVFIAVNGKETVKAFVPGINVEQMNGAFKKYAASNIEELALTSNCIFLSTTFRHVFIVHRNQEHPDAWLRIVEVNKTSATVQISDQLLEKLFKTNNPPAMIEELW